MNINEIRIKLKNIFSKKDLEKIAEQGAEKVQATLEEFREEENIDEVQIATEAAMEEMLKYPERQLAVEMIGNINENVSSEVAVNAVIQLTETEEFSEKTAIEVATQNDFTDEHIKTIIEESSIGYEGKTAIAETLKDEKIREKVQQKLDNEEEQRCLKQLDEIYLQCNEDMNELQLGCQLNAVMDSIPFHTDAIQEKINRIIAKKIAFNFARYGSNMVSKQTALMSANKMREVNMVQIAREEYEKIASEYESIKGYKIKEFDEKILINDISAEMEGAAKTDAFNEENAFKQIKSLMKTFMIYDERKERLIGLKKEIQDEETRKTYKMIRELAIVDKLNELPESERKKVLETLVSVLDKRKDKEHRLRVAKKTPKIKSYEFTTNAKKSNEERE